MEIGVSGLDAMSEVAIDGHIPSFIKESQRPCIRGRPPWIPCPSVTCVTHLAPFKT